eukprot:scaffold4177_cov37-Phaeocystis_antarctica.AAC.2
MENASSKNRHTLAALVGHEGRWATLAGLVHICPWGTLVNLTPKYPTLVSTTYYPPVRTPAREHTRPAPA